MLIWIWSCFLIIGSRLVMINCWIWILDMNQYIFWIDFWIDRKYLSRSMIQFILTTQLFIIFLIHIKNYPLTWLKNKQNSKADTERNPTDIPLVEYQDYLNTKEIYSKNDSKEHTTYLIHLTKCLFYNPICFWIKLVIFPKNLKLNGFPEI